MMKFSYFLPPLAGFYFALCSALLTANAAYAQSPVRLPAVIAAPESVSSDSRNNYWVQDQSSATKSGSSVMNTPQSVSTITRKQLDDQNYQTASQAMGYSAGVLAGVDVNARADSVFLRGFGAFGTATQYASFLDGMKLAKGQAFAVPSMDPYLLDRIDVLKGPSALMYGQTSPGGVVNMVSREPGADPHGELRLEAGSHGRTQGGFSSQGALDPEGKWQYSLAAIARDAGTRYSGVREQRLGIAPALTWQPDAGTKLTLSAFYQRDPEGGYFNSILARQLAPEKFRNYLDRNLNVGDRDFDHYDRTQYGIGYAFEHALNEQLTFKSKFRYSHVNTDMSSYQMTGLLNEAGLMPRQALNSVERASGITFDNYLESRFATGQVRHTVVAGVDVQRSQSDWLYRYGQAPALDVTAPVSAVPLTPLAPIIDNHETLRQTGLYIQDQLSWNRWHAVIGARYDWASQATKNRLVNSWQRQSDKKPSYRLSLLYRFDNGLAPYFSYSTSFEPTSGVGADGSAFVPRTAKQYEAGIKYQPTGINAMFTASIFDIRQKNVLTPGAMPGFNVQQGEIRSRGLELEVRGNITPNLDVIAAYTLLNTEITESSMPDVIGKRPQAVPRQFGSVWANYRVSKGILAGLRMGAGIRLVGSSFGDDENEVRSAGHGVVDAALAYDLGAISPAMKGVRATLNVNNLFDKKYYASCSSGFFCQYGNERQVLAGVRYTW